MTAPVRELRLVVTVPDYDAAVAFYRDVLGMPEAAEYVSEDGGRVVILEAGQATLEIGDATHAAAIDQLEVGRRVAGPLRVALRVEDVDDRDLGRGRPGWRRPRRGRGGHALGFAQRAPRCAGRPAPDPVRGRDAARATDPTRWGYPLGLPYASQGIGVALPWYSVSIAVSVDCIRVGGSWAPRSAKGASST